MRHTQCCDSGWAHALSRPTATLWSIFMADRGKPKAPSLLAVVVIGWTGTVGPASTDFYIANITHCDTEAEQIPGLSLCDNQRHGIAITVRHDYHPLGQGRSSFMSLKRWRSVGSVPVTLPPTRWWSSAQARHKLVESRGQ